MPQDAGFVFSPAFRVVTDAIAAVAGGSIEFYAAGTSTPKTVYSDATLSTSLGSTVYLDSGGHPVASQGSSTKVVIYTGAAKIKMILKDANGTTLATYDNVQCAQDTSAFTSGSGSGITGVDTGSTDRTIVAADDGKLFRRDPTSGDVTVTFPDATAVDIGDGFTFGIQHSGTTTTNRVKFQSVSSQTIDMEGKSVLAGALTGAGETIWFVCDGAGWQVTSRTPPLVFSDISSIRVKSRLSAPPTSPTAGARYILRASPSGAWASFSQHDIVEATGLGTWTRWTPPTDCGWFAYIEDENLNTQFQDSAWVDLAGATLPTQTVKRAIYQHITAQNTAATTLTAASWQTVVWTTEAVDDIGITLSSNQITPTVTNKLRIDIRRTFTSSGSPSANGVARLRLRNVTANTVVAYGDTTPITNSNAGTLTLVTDFTPNGTDAYVVEVYGSVGLVPGGVQNLSGISEHHGTMELTDLAGVRGATGLQGNTGADGADAGWKYTWSSNTSASDPSSGGIKGNNATLGSITAIYISETDADANGLASEIAAWDDSTSTTAARATIKIGNSAGMILFKITGANTDNGTWVTLTGYVVASRGSLTGTVRVAPALTGDKGDTGSPGAAATIAVGTTTTGTAGSSASVTNSGSSSAATFNFTIPRGDTGATGPNTGLDYAWDTGTTDANPGNGNIRVNNATLGSATFVYISKTDRPGNSQGTNIDQWDASTNTAHLGTLRVFDVATRTKGFTAEVTSTFTDGTTYWKIPLNSISTLSGGAPSASDVLAVMWHRTGNKGADGTGSFTSLTPGNGVTATLTAAAPGSAITTSGTISAAEPVNAQTGTTYTFLDSDRAKLVTFSNASPVAVTLPQAATTIAFVSGWFTDAVNLNAGPVTITPTTSTINGASSVVLQQGQGIRIVSDGTNYQLTRTPAMRGPSASVNDEIALYSGTAGSLLKRATTTGILKGTSGVLSAAVAGTDFVAPGGALGTPSSGTLTNCTGLPAAGLVASTSQAVGFGTIELGHATDTTLSRASAGVLAVEGVIQKSVGRETIYIPAAAMSSRTTNGAATGTVETTTNRVMFRTLDFDTTTQEFAQMAIRMPKSWNEGTVQASFTWSHASTTTNFGVVWALEAVAISDLDAGDAAFGTAQQVADTGGTTNTIYVTSATSAITIAGTPQPEDWVVFQVKRVPADASDTMAIDARLHGVTLYFTTDAANDA